MRCVKAWVAAMVSVDKVSVDAVSVWCPGVPPGVFLVHRAGRFCLMSRSMAAQVVWTRSV